MDPVRELRAFVAAFLPPERHADWTRALDHLGRCPAWLETRLGPDVFDVLDRTVTWRGIDDDAPDLADRLVAAAPEPLDPTAPVPVLDRIDYEPRLQVLPLGDALRALADGDVDGDTVISVRPGALALVRDHHDGLRWCRAVPV